MNSPKRLARIAGVLYLLNGIAAGFAIAIVDAKVYVPGDAAARRAHPRRGLNAPHTGGGPSSRPPRGAECRLGMPARTSMTNPSPIRGTGAAIP